MKKMNSRKFQRGIMMGAILGTATFVTLLVFLAWYFITGGFPKTGKGPEAYPDIFELHLQSELMVFPNEISGTVEEPDFYYYHRHGFGAPTYEIYLKCTYEPEAYEEELKRLEQVHRISRKRVWTLRRDETGAYRYPAYIAMENRYHGYEYALLTGENQIAYICTGSVKGNMVPFPKEYLPKDFLTKEDPEFPEGYSIYMGTEGSGLPNTHMERIGDGYFVVVSLWDDRFPQVIDKCYFDNHPGPFAVSSETTYYPELGGKKFLDMEVSEDNTRVTVRYYDTGDVIRETDIVLPLGAEE